MSRPEVWGHGYSYSGTLLRNVVFPAKAGIYVTPTLRDYDLKRAFTPTCEHIDTGEATWIPAFAGMTEGLNSYRLRRYLTFPDGLWDIPRLGIYGFHNGCRKKAG